MKLRGGLDEDYEELLSKNSRKENGFGIDRTGHYMP
jgi:hypothetical protein